MKFGDGLICRWCENVIINAGNDGERFEGVDGWNLPRHGEWVELDDSRLHGRSCESMMHTLSDTYISV